MSARFFVFVALTFLVEATSAQRGPYVWDLLKPALTAGEVVELLLNAKAGETYPILNDIPSTNFQCTSQKQPGFYADVDTQCQVFHRLVYDLFDKTTLVMTRIFVGVMSTETGRAICV